MSPQNVLHLQVGELLQVVNKLLAKQEQPLRPRDGLRRFGSGHLPGNYSGCFTCGDLDHMQHDCSERRQPQSGKGRSPAAPSTARLPTLKPVIEKVANTEDGPLVKGRVSGVEVTFIVDMGANVTIVKPSVLNRMNASERPPLEQVETSMLLADGSSLPFLGRGRFNVCLGKRKFLMMCGSRR